ncbi:hypothetical protein SEA_BILLNYE_248 [Streptomyces phage BillNye]|uniref:Uncharacterized protein n=1 Tax=Streptomyces phage BillNye TaxID=2079426 RepID=A0A2L1IVL6_9CAUD|nr:hypothetical protein FDJ30_gp002 [Streptomyces phage BillNye]YP_009622795.1 hypothetical protein FDJ30_gp014 [Streptomyces phage BillNye]AVD99207.1 hypothetical protein SEA_BILLNYE_2 [Streptomyces phage BillNye]AVD99417.1 hypothetical protein SEA_BILLNYE_248 [Streptomyces phage BillNye]
MEYPEKIEVCPDCLFLIANGEVTDSEGNDISETHAAEMQAIWGDSEITLGRVKEGDETEEEFQANDEIESEGWFSWRECQGCGSRLGGTRYYATVWLQA